MFVTQKQFKRVIDYVVNQFNIVNKHKNDNTCDMLTNIRDEINQLKGQVRGAQSKLDKYGSNNPSLKMRIHVLEQTIANANILFIKHAERIDGIAKVLNLDWVDKVETKVTKEYQKTKKEK